MCPMWVNTTKYAMYVIVVYKFFFFKQKTAYEMRISDWSSDVCSSDLPLAPWLAWLGRHFGGAAGGAWPAPRVDVYADRLDYLGQSFEGVRLQVDRTSGV